MEPEQAIKEQIKNLRHTLRQLELIEPDTVSVCGIVGLSKVEYALGNPIVGEAILTIVRSEIMSKIQLRIAELKHFKE